MTLLLLLLLPHGCQSPWGGVSDVTSGVPIGRSLSCPFSRDVVMQYLCLLYIVTPVTRQQHLRKKNVSTQECWFLVILMEWFCGERDSVNLRWEVKQAIGQSEKDIWPRGGCVITSVLLHLDCPSPSLSPGDLSSPPGLSANQWSCQRLLKRDPGPGWECVSSTRHSPGLSVSFVDVV